ncbi:MAG: phosphate ABC transporter permease subunit PstC [Rickettsiales bacterium]|nr:phosphate ABC transporter permease subunit PstC [Rickettsiales bacterium]
MIIFLFLTVIILSLAFFLKVKYQKLRASAGKKGSSVSLPIHYSYCFALWSFVALFLVLILIPGMVAKIVASLLVIGGCFLLIDAFFAKDFNSKKHIEGFGVGVLSITAGIGILITIIITVSILFESLRFFKFVNFFDFLFGLSWNPQTAITADQEVGQSAFGVVPVFLGTLLIMLIAMFVSVPIGIMGAIYLCLYAKSKTRDYLKPVIEILAGVPTVVYGYFAVITIAPFFKSLFAAMGINLASESALSAGFVMGVMIIPFVLSLTDDALNSVPQALKDGALAMGSTQSETIKRVVLPSAMPSIIGAIILAVSRAIGETMIVVMAAGLVAKLTFNPLDAVTTATAQIVTLLTGDTEFDSPKTLAAFALALTLFVFTFIFNIVALMVMKNYKKKYS